MRTESTAQVSPDERPALSAHREACEQAFAKARRAGKSLVRITVAAPIAPLLTDSEASILWCSPGDTQWVGSGRAATVSGSGPDRFAQVKESAEALWQSLHDAPQPGTKPAQPRLFGGLSFAERDPQGPWRHFGQALFWLPRRLYGQDGERAWLSITAGVDESPQELAEELLAGQRYK